MLMALTPGAIGIKTTASSSYCTRYSIPATACSGILGMGSEGLFEERRRRPLSGTARHHEIADGDLHGLAVLVQRRRAQLDQALVRTRLRRPHFEHFALEMQLIPGTHGARPAELVEAGADDAAGGPQFALDQEPHGERGG